MDVTAGTNITQEEANYDLQTVDDGKIENFDGDSGKVAATVTVDEGTSLSEAVDMYGEDVVFELYTRQLKRDLGNAIRSSLNGGRSPSGVEQELGDWRPDVKRSGGGGSASMEEQFQNLTPEEQRQKLEQLANMANA